MIVWGRQPVCINYAGFIQSVEQNTGFMLPYTGNSFLIIVLVIPSFTFIHCEQRRHTAEFALYDIRKHC